MATESITKVSNDSASNYCKMADGTLLMWGETLIASSGDRVQVNYPITPLIIPFVYITASESGAAAGLDLRVFDRNMSRFFIYRKSNSGTNQYVMWFAVSRWK